MTNKNKEPIVTRTRNRKEIVDKVKRSSADAIEANQEPLQELAKSFVGYLLERAINKLRESAN